MQNSKSLTPLAVAGIVVVVLVGIVLYNWNGAPAEVHKVYFADNISPAHRAVIERFNALHRGSIEVEAVNLPFDKFTTNERKELLARSLRNKSDRIDVFAVDLIWIPRFSKWSEPLGHQFDDDILGTILEKAIESCYVESTLVAMPLYLDIGMMYYRSDLLRRLPNWQSVEAQLKESITWDDFLKLRESFNDPGQPFYIFAAKDFEGLVCNYLELLVGQLGEYSNTAPLDLGSPEARKALEMMVNFVRRSKTSPSQVTAFDENRSYDYMLAHNGIFCRGWPNFLENYTTFYPDTAKLRALRRAALPHFRGMKPRAVYGGWSLMVSKYSRNKEQAIEFIRFLQSEESQKMMFDIGGYLPTNRNVYADVEYMKHHPNLAYYKKLLENGFHRPALADYTRISDIISHYVHRAIKGDLAPDQALQMAAQDIRATNAVED
ncbi:MAG: extracellular solute-binding protein [Ignavibacteriae bacterium]|nr:extracellular solute-binding protein [Ignavibacteriota bacterium]